MKEKLLRLQTLLEDARCTTHRAYQEASNECPTGKLVLAELRAMGDEIPCCVCESRAIVKELLTT